MYTLPESRCCLRRSSTMRLRSLSNRAASSWRMARISSVGAIGVSGIVVAPLKFFGCANHMRCKTAVAVLALQLFQEPIVFRVRTHPKPINRVAFPQPQHPPTQTDACRVDRFSRMYLLELKAGMRRVLPPKTERLSCLGLDGQWQRRETSHKLFGDARVQSSSIPRFLTRPARMSSRTRSARRPN